MSTTTKTNFDRTREAIAKFDATKAERDDAWANATTDMHCNRALAADKVALQAVQEAFYLDTQHINSRDNCLRIDIQFMRRMAKESGNG